MNEGYSNSRAQAIKLGLAKVGEVLVHPLQPRLVKLDENGKIVKLVKHKKLSPLERDWESVMIHTTSDE